MKITKAGVIEEIRKDLVIIEREESNFVSFLLLRRILDYYVNLLKKLK